MELVQALFVAPEGQTSEELLDGAMIFGTGFAPFRGGPMHYLHSRGQDNVASALESLAEPPGAEPDRLLMASFDLAQLRFSSAESDAFYAALLDRASSLPGAAAAGLALVTHSDVSPSVQVGEGRTAVQDTAGTSARPRRRTRTFRTSSPRYIDAICWGDINA